MIKNKKYDIELPIKIQKDENLSDGCKIFLGHLLHHMDKHKFIEYNFVDLLEITKKSLAAIKRYFILLQKNGYVSIAEKIQPIEFEDGKLAWIYRRKIYVPNIKPS